MTTDTRAATPEEVAALTARLAQAEKVAGYPQLRLALVDMLAGWRYIRQAHGDLYGVGWDRAQSNAEAALGDTPQAEGPGSSAASGATFVFDAIAYAYAASGTTAADAERDRLRAEVATLKEQVATLTARAEQWQRANGGNDEPE